MNLNVKMKDGGLNTVLSHQVGDLTPRELRVVLLLLPLGGRQAPRIYIYIYINIYMYMFIYDNENEYQCVYLC